MALTAFLGRKHGLELLQGGSGHENSPHPTPSTRLVSLGLGKPVTRGGWSRAGLFSDVIPKPWDWFEHWAPSVVPSSRKGQWIAEA